jgi:hypothetical protein
MKARLLRFLTLFIALAPISVVAQLETAFTYQGRLADSAGAAAGQYDFIFSLYDDAGEQVGSSITNLNVPVLEGHFVSTLDFGPSSFRRMVVWPRGVVGPGEWLEISVRTNRAKSYQMLAPRQRLTPTPYASTVTGRLPSLAIEGNYTEKVTFGNVSNAFLGTFYGDGANLTNLNVSGMWALSGNAGTTAGPNFLGTSDNQALELRVNYQRALRLVPQASSPTLIGGSAVNSVAAGVAGAVISGGGSAANPNSVAADYGVVAGGASNVVQTGSTYGAILGGRDNLISGDASYSIIGGGSGNVVGASGGWVAVGGGLKNTAGSWWTAIGGGQSNSATAVSATVAGGTYNRAAADYASIGGGRGNRARGNFATVPGGEGNDAYGDYSFGAGRNAHAYADGSFVWADSTTTAGYGPGTTQSNTFWVRSTGGARFHTGTNALWTEAEMSCATLTIRGGADLAEPFAISDDTVLPGSVVVIDPGRPGRLKLSTSAYDVKVAGIVSGAGGVQPGISMTQTDALERGRNVALSGRVYALVDATRHPVRPGDLLTTSDTPGHAMKVANPALAQGAILGKAMTPLPGGRGLVLVLVSLQ